jgi:S-layer protein
MTASTVVNDTSLDNVAPVAEDAAIATTEAGAAVDGQLVATDAEGDALTFELVAAVEGLTLNADGSYTFDPAANTAAQALTYTDQPLVIAAAYTVTDALGAVSETKTLSITVEPTPLTIELVADANFVEEGSEIAYTLVASEAIQGEAITGTIQILPGDGTSGQTSAADFGSGSFNPQTVTIAVGATTSDAATITPTNDAAAELPESYTASATVEGFEIADLAGEVRDPSSVGGLGQTFTLTTGVDTIPGLQGSAGTTGTDGDDTIIAQDTPVNGLNIQTFGALDSINGGAGTDTFNIFDQNNAINVAGSNVSSVEVVNVAGAAAVTVDSRNWSGLENLNVNQAGGAVTLTAAATTDVTASGLGNFTTTINAGKSATVTQAMDNAGDSIVIDNVGDVTVTATNSAAAAGGIAIGGNTAVTGAVNVTSTGADVAFAIDGGATAVALDAIAVTGGTTVNVTQDANSVSGNAATNVDNVGDIITQGAVTVTGGNATTNVTVVQDDQVTARAAQAGVTGVQETKTVTFTAMGTGDNVTVDGLTFTAAKALTAEEVAAAFAGLSASDRQDAGGPTANGVFTGVTSANWTSGAANGAVVTFTAVVAANGNATALNTAFNDAGADNTITAAPAVANGIAGVTAVNAVEGVAGVANGAVQIDDNATASITDIEVDGYSANAVLGGNGGSLDALANLTLRNSGAGTATLTSTAATLNVTMDDVDAAVNLGNNVTSLTLNTEGTASTGAVAAANATALTINAEASSTLNGSTFTAAETITVNGSAAVNLTGAIANAATLQSINASGNTGGVTAVLGATNAVAFTGGAGNDSLTLGSANIVAGDDIALGAGNDTLVIAANTTAGTIAASVNGGEGTDTLSMGFADAVAVSAANTAFDDEVLGFERLTINNVATDGDNTATATHTVNLANLTYDYVTVNGTGDFGVALGQDTLALTNMAANGTVVLAAQGLYSVALADASGSSDVLNVITTVAQGDINAGTLTAANVETINITADDTDNDHDTDGNLFEAGERQLSTLDLNAVNATSVVIDGDANLTLDMTGNTAVTSINASALTGNLSVTAFGTATVTGGSGNDQLVANGSGDTLIGGAGNDTLTGADLTTLTGGEGNDIFMMNMPTNVNSYSTITDLSAGDVIDLDAGNAGTVVFTASAVTLASTAVFQDFANAAVNALGTDTNDAAWFQYDGNTYIVQSGADHSAATGTPDFQSGTDSIIQITGLVDLSTASYNQTIGTLEIA